MLFQNSSIKSVEITDDEKQVLTKQVKELDQQIDLCNVQIADLQQKLIDADQGGNPSQIVFCFLPV